MKQKVLKKLGLLALSGIMVAPNVLGGKILENNSKPIGNEKAYPKLSTKDAGKNPKKESTVKAKSGSGFFGKLFKLVGGVVVLNETHNLIRNLIGNPWFCLGMAAKLYGQAHEGSLSKATLADYDKSGNILEYFQRKTDDCNIENQHDISNEHLQNRKINTVGAPYEYEKSSTTTTPKPVFQGILTPMSKAEATAHLNAGKQFAENHPYLALLILKRFDTMIALGIDKFRGVATFDEASTNPSDQQNDEPTLQTNVQPNIDMNPNEHQEFDPFDLF